MAFHTPTLFSPLPINRDQFQTPPVSPLKRTGNRNPGDKTRQASFNDVARQASRKLGKIEKHNVQTTTVVSIPRVIHHLDPNTTTRVQRASNKLSEYLHHLSNEPSIGLYHVTEHISRSVPKFIEMKTQLRLSNRAVEDLSYDVDSTLITIKDLGDLNTFTNIKGLLQQAMRSVDQMIKKIPYQPPAGPMKQIRPPTYTPIPTQTVPNPMNQVVPEKSGPPINPVEETTKIPEKTEPQTQIPIIPVDIELKEPAGTPLAEVDTTDSSPGTEVFIASKNTQKGKKTGKEPKKPKEFTLKKFDT